jgi:hypothetical protein
VIILTSSAHLLYDRWYKVETQFHKSMNTLKTTITAACKQSSSVANCGNKAAQQSYRRYAKTLAQAAKDCGSVAANQLCLLQGGTRRHSACAVLSLGGYGALPMHGMRTKHLVTDVAATP